MAPTAGTSTGGPIQIVWFRRDLRLGDHPALLEAADNGAVLPLFVLDERLLKPSGAPRVAWLLRSLQALDADLREHGAHLVVRTGDPVVEVPRIAAEVGAGAVHISADHAPYGAERDTRVEQALRGVGDGVPLVRTGSPYAVSPGRVVNGTGEPFKVFSAFHRAWLRHGWRAPADSDPARVTWAEARSDQLPDGPQVEHRLPEAGEAAALAAWQDFDAEEYDEIRDRPDLDRTSRMAAHLKIGAIHPRTMLADLGPPHDPLPGGAETYRKELAWREFYADVLWARPETAREYYRPEFTRLPYVAGADLAEHLRAWQRGRTGFPIVDAGMRQLLAEGFMHNRVRMIVASFLVKDLQVEWMHGARHFMDHLLDGDLASNSHNWQWVAGCGTDAAPYFRVFNPVTQGKKFDPDGDYVRRWVPELRGVGSTGVHEPWTLPEPPADYPDPMVDHAEMRKRALADYQHLRGT